ncbi:MAG: SpoIID/LytB domain-containing protein [Oscillospiraceae bacterium]|jgi:stage II sporulation protein D|nr:SpoIID/LytB domain-containing protein [Oscillospiraceae bacterium]
MKKGWKRVCSCVLLCVLCAGLLMAGPGPARALLEANPTLRIGLFYDSTALPAANLENYAGAGYRLGFLQEDKQFAEVGRLSSPAQITVIKNRTLYLKDRVYSDTPSTGSVTVGCYHIDTGRTYASFAEAQNGATALRGQDWQAFPVYSYGAYRVRIGAYATSAAAAEDIPRLGIDGAIALSGSAYCVSVVRTESGDMLFQFDGGTERSLSIWPSLGEVSDPITWFKGYKYRGGFEYRRVTGNNITVINWVTLQDYVKGILPYEMSASWSLEALKAQALCAKSFAVSSLGKHRSAGFDLCNTVHCQVYQGTNAANANSDKAVDETYGRFVYYNGKVAETVYHSHDGGATESAANVWGSEIAYLQAVIDTFEEPAKIPNGLWQYTYTNSDINAILKDKGISAGSIVSAYIDQFTPAGNVYRLTLVDSSGKKYNFVGEKARTTLNSTARGLQTRSQRYNIIPGGGGGAASLTIAGGVGTAVKTNVIGLYAVGGDGVQALTGTLSGLQVQSKDGIFPLSAATGFTGGNGTYLFTGSGHGHNVGLSQYGAKAMSDQGYSAEDIIHFYYASVDVLG